MHPHLVEARCRHGEAQQPVDPDHTTPARGEGEGGATGLGSLADLAGPHVGDEVARLPHSARPIGEQADERRLLVPAKVSAKGCAVVLLQYACPQNTPRRSRTGGPPYLHRGGRAGRNG